MEKACEIRDIDSTICFLDFYNDKTGEDRQFCYAHRKCVQNYLQKNELTALFYDGYVKPLISDMLTQDYGLSISEIRDYLSEKRPGLPFHNQWINSYIQNTFGSQVSFESKSSIETLFLNCLQLKTLLLRYMQRTMSQNHELFLSA